MNKKAQSNVWPIIVAAIIALAVLIIILLMSSGGFKKGFGSLDDTLDTFGDCDEDDVKDVFDKCKCEYGSESNVEYPGCPSNVDEESYDKETNGCSEDQEKNCKDCGKLTCSTS